MAVGIICYYSLAENPHHHFLTPVRERALAAGDEILVQVSRENVKTKQPTVTSNLNFTGKYVVLTSQKRGVGISNKIHDRQRICQLKQLAQNFLRDDFGIIFRTNAGSALDEEILQETDR